MLSETGRITSDGTGVYNGDMGIIKKIDSVNETVTVEFDDKRIAIYEFTALEELELSYAVTIHKSQGSEYPVVIMPVLKEYGIMLQKRLLYTGITRATKTLILIGSKLAFEQGLNNHRFEQRNTTLQTKVAKEYQLNHDQLNRPENYPEE